MSTDEITVPAKESTKLHFFEVFPWNENFNTGHPIIDEQHKKLVELLNKLANTLVSNQQEDVEYAFSELAKYADYHFATEEEIWVEHFGPDNWFHSHLLSHSSFLPKVLEIREKGADQPLYLIIEDIVKFLIRWLAFHIINDDKRYALVISEVSKGKSLEEAKTMSDRKMNASSVRVLIDTVLSMYDGLSNRTLNLLRERRARAEVEGKLKLAYLELEAANKRLEASAITDHLTGLYNRRHFDSILRKEIIRAQREHSLLTLISIDIDDFKKLNDTYGHQGGDEALIAVGKKLQDVCKRAGDYTFRIGGEEFAIVACGTSDIDRCHEFAEFIRKEVAELMIPNALSGVSPTLTISLGIVSLFPDEEETADSLYSKADQRLYEAKQKGKNQVVGCY